MADKEIKKSEFLKMLIRQNSNFAEFKVDLHGDEKLLLRVVQVSYIIKVNTIKN